MIQTDLSQAHRYAGLHPRLAAAFAALRELAEKPFVPGRYPIDGDALFINAFSYETRPEETAMMEAHQRYIDVMLLCDGEEQVLVCPTQRLTGLTRAYDPADDALLAKPAADCTSVSLLPGDMVIFFPEDAHGPELALHESLPVNKYIAKVLLEAPAEQKEG